MKTKSWHKALSRDRPEGDSVDLVHMKGFVSIMRTSKLASSIWFISSCQSKRLVPVEDLNHGSNTFAGAFNVFHLGI